MIKVILTITLHPSSSSSSSSSSPVCVGESQCCAGQEGERSRAGRATEGSAPHGDETRQRAGEKRMSEESERSGDVEEVRDVGWSQVMACDTFPQ
ncbi:hypothetical protein WMY93_022026 [Mugilogobius chulae]|uniref:Uncharacterized protein n=1 Tax=Mugilogobius chulae TaxID=88201 RepID=A0AAW0NI13_9GOBI